MAATSPETRPPPGAVLIVLPDELHGRPVDELEVALLGCAAASDAAQRPRPAFSLWRAAGAALVLAALAVAGCFLLGAGSGAGAVSLFLAANSDRSSFLLPLYPKARPAGGAPRNSTLPVLPHTGNVFPNGQYYTAVSLGNPPRPYFLDVDTGSDLTWIQCNAPCSNCATGPHRLYKPASGNIIPSTDSFCHDFRGSQNSVHTSHQCDYEIEYADRSSSLGVLARDNVQLMTEDGGRENLDIVFGCGYDQQGNLLSSLANTDGVLGLSGAEISLPTQLAGQGIISNVFGHCITADPRGGGYLFLGDDYIPGWGMTWAPIQNGPGNIYSTRVQKVSYGDQHLGVRELAGNLTRLIFDSGSTYTYFPHKAYTNLIAVLKDASPRFVQDDSDKTLPFCVKADFPVRSVDDVKQFFKPLTLQFENRLVFFPRTFTLYPEDYLIISDKGNVCLGVLDARDIGSYASQIILGDISLRRKLIVYDNDENQIGWVESECTNPSKRKGFSFFLRKALLNQFL